MLDKLEAFLALARTRHFARAAEELGVAQPTLSAAIRALEAELGVLLVERGSRFRGLTPEGQRVLEWARRIVGDTRALKDEMRAARVGLKGRVRLAVVPTALAAVPRLTTPFRARHPDVTFHIQSRNSVEILALVGNHEVDAGITYLDNEPMGRVASVPLYHERYRLITSAGAPLAGRDRVTWAEVAALPLCLLTPDMQNRRIIDRLIAGAGGTASPALESNSMITLYAHVRAGGWCSVMPQLIAETLDLSGALRSIPIVEPDAANLIGLVAAWREPHTPLVSALLYEARQFALPGAV